MPETASRYFFLSGADMNPTAVRTAFPGAVFVARAHLEARQGEVNPHFGPGVAASGLGKIWGVLIEATDAQASDRQRNVTTDDGRTFSANLVGDRFVNGDPAAVLKAAHYWELYPGYVALLAKVVHPLGIERTPQHTQ